MENLYFMAITPPEDISNKIIRIQEDISIRFGSRVSLKVMPHITLKAPFKIPSVAHPIVLDWFENLDLNVSRFDLELKDFGAFHNKNQPVIFINPEPNVSLMKLQSEILEEFQNAFPGISIMNLEINFHPHLTVAYRDLTVDEFRKAWPEFKVKKFSETQEVHNFHLLKHDGKRWNIIRSVSLK